MIEKFRIKMSMDVSASMVSDAQNEFIACTVLSIFVKVKYVQENTEQKTRKTSVVLVQKINLH